MITNPLLEEIWAIKDRLNAECGGDIHVLCQQVREWSAKNMPKNMVVCDPAGLRALLEKQELEEPIALREEPPKFLKKKD